jgi:hypothetical protein
VSSKTRGYDNGERAYKGSSMARLSLEQVREGLLGDPSIYPQNLELTREAILFLRVDRKTFDTASFLDDRILTPQSEVRWVALKEIAPLLSGAAQTRPLHFIFHSGHVGSTLISRLLDEAGGVLSLREPLALRALAGAADDAGAPHALVTPPQIETLLRWFTLLWARGYPDTKSVVLKATSSAERLAPALLSAAPNARALTMNLRAEPYVATLLSGENSYLDLRGHGPERYRRLTRLAAPPPTPLYAMSPGEMAALAWLSETLTQRHAQRAFGERVLALDFDAFLNDPGGAMRSVCAHFGVNVSDAFLANVPNSPVLQRYSKAPEHAFTAALRAQILAQSRAVNGAEIRKGLAWLDAMAQRAPTAAAALSA